MKVRSLKDIERDIRKETEKANSAAQYDMYASSIDDMFRAALAVVVAVFHRRGRSKQYIKKIAEDFMFVLECPPIFGKQLSSTELMKQFEKECRNGIYGENDKCVNLGKSCAECWNEEMKEE